MTSKYHILATVTQDMSAMAQQARNKVKKDQGQIRALLSQVPLNATLLDTFNASLTISPLNLSAMQIDTFSLRQEGTAQWLIESPIFKDWLCGQLETLWCSGIGELLNQYLDSAD